MFIPVIIIYLSLELSLVSLIRNDSLFNDTNPLLLQTNKL